MELGVSDQSASDHRADMVPRVLHRQRKGGLQQDCGRQHGSSLRQMN